MPSAAATGEPPYFCTMSATNGRTSRVRMDLESIRYGLIRSSGALAHVEAGVRDHRVQSAQRGAAAGSPGVEIAVLPPPQRLEGPSGLVVPEPVDEIGGDRRDVIGDPELQ